MIDRTQVMTRALWFVVAVFADISCATPWPATQEACLANVPACSARCIDERSQSTVGPACAALAVQYVKEHADTLAQQSDQSPKFGDQSLSYLQGATMAACIHEVPYGCEASRLVRLEAAKQAATAASPPPASNEKPASVGTLPPLAPATGTIAAAPTPQAWMVACARIARVHLEASEQRVSPATLAAPTLSCVASLRETDLSTANATVGCIETKQSESCLSGVGGAAALARPMR